MSEAVTGTFRSVTGNELYKSVWAPDGEVRAVVQIIHGMAEYIDCYDETAKRLNEAGILVVGHNLPGHGKGAAQLGHFGNGGFDALVEDAHTLRGMTQKDYPEAPYFLLGHSMGSFLACDYCLVHQSGLAGVVLSAMGFFTPLQLLPGLALANLICALGGEKKPAKLLEAISFAGYNRDWAPPRTEKDWISSNTRKVDAYVADPLCGFTITAGAYRDMFLGMQKLYPKKLSALDKRIPVLLYSGALDPLGGRGAGVRKFAAALKGAGVMDVTVKLYENGRHEMHNEPNREEVLQYLIDWMFSRL